MASMRAVVLDDWGGDLAVENVDRPEPGPGEVRVDVKACAVTRTIENAIQGGLAADPALTPRIPGHEFAGVVDAVGDEVTDVAVGDRVLAYFYLHCGTCQPCRAGTANRCENFGGWFGVNTQGAYAEYTVLPERNVLPLPDGAGFAAGAIATDGLATPLHVCDRVDVGFDDHVLVIGGAGRIGIHLAQAAALHGARVVAADVTRDRLEHVDAHTTDAVTPIDARGEGYVDRLVDATDGGPTVVVDTVGHPGALADAWDALAMGGRLVSLTTHHDRGLDEPLADLVRKEATVMGSRYATKTEVVTAAEMFATGRITPVVRETVGLDDVPAVHDAIRDGSSFGTVVLEP